MEHVKERIDNFLQHPQKKILVLKGKWGVGKTHFWRKYIEDKAFSEVIEKKYSYVSLFGVSTVQEVEDLLFSKTIALEGCNRVSELSQKAIDKFKWVQDLPKIKDFAGIAKRISRIFIKEYLICLDDLERCDPELTIKALLGFVSQLKEENNCRIVLIFNHDKLVGKSSESGSDKNSSSKKELERYYEKVIDDTISYDPTVESNVSLIFKNEEEYAIVYPTFMRLGIKNIRIMQQTKWNMDYFTSCFDSLEEVVEQQVCNHIIMLTCFRYDADLKVDVDKLPKATLQDYWNKVYSAEDGDKKDVINRCDQYGYMPAEYDRYIIEYIVDGVCDIEEFKEQLEKINEREKQNQILAKHSEIWGAYGGNFQTTSDEICSMMKTFLDDNASQLDYRQLKEATDLLVEIDNGIDITIWVDDYVSGSIGSSSLKGLLHLEKLTENSELLDCISQRIELLKSDISIESLIANVVGRSGWSPEVVEQLNSFSEQEFKDAFLASNRKSLFSLLNEFLSHWKNSSRDGEKAVVVKMRAALIDIAEISAFHNKRVKMIMPAGLEDIEG